MGAGQALPWLALALLPFFAAARAWSRPTEGAPTTTSESQPYLAIIGAPSLRFEEAAPPPDLVTHPAAAAPPHPALADEPNLNPPAPAVQAAPAPHPASAPVRASTDSAQPTTSSNETSDTPAPAPTPRPILPDEIRPQARPEDFLPFFQIPSAQPGVNVVVPVPRAPAAPGPLPPSSATYTQTPR